MSIYIIHIYQRGFLKKRWQRWQNQFPCHFPSDFWKMHVDNTLTRLWPALTGVDRWLWQLDTTRKQENWRKMNKVLKPRGFRRITWLTLGVSGGKRRIFSRAANSRGRTFFPSNFEVLLGVARGMDLYFFQGRRSHVTGRPFGVDATWN